MSEQLQKLVGDTKSDDVGRRRRLILGGAWAVHLLPSRVVAHWRVVSVIPPLPLVRLQPTLLVVTNRIPLTAVTQAPKGGMSIQDKKRHEPKIGMGLALI